MELAFKYFFIAGSGVGLGLSLTIIPSVLLAIKLKNGGIRRGKRNSKA